MSSVMSSSSVHRGERQDLERNSKEAASIALAHVQQKFKGTWRELFKTQRDEVRPIETIQGNPLERAAYVFMNAYRLSGSRNLSDARSKLRLGSITDRAFRSRGPDAHPRAAVALECSARRNQGSP